MANYISVEDKISILNSRIELLQEKGPLIGMTDIDERVDAIKKERDRFINEPL